MKPFLTTLLILTVALLITPEVFAQVPPPMLPGSPEQAPIDGGLALLAAAGGGYAIKKLRGKKRFEDDL